jgi:hypothetical protein
LANSDWHEPTAAHNDAESKFNETGLEMSKGVLIFKGMTVEILPGDFVISTDDAGKEDAKLILSTAYNVVPIWLKIGVDSLRQSRLASAAIANTWNDDAEHQKQLLLAELAPSMQAFVACGIALDALYDTMRPLAKISADTVAIWRKKRTSRARQVVEVLRRTHKLKGKELKDFTACIEHIFKYRDAAVHPSLEARNAVGRTDLPVGVDWKFAVYCYKNADSCVQNTINMIVYLWEHKAKLESIDAPIANMIDALLEMKILKKNE